MSHVFRALGRLVTSFPRTVVAVWAVVVLVTGAWALTGLGGQGLFDRMAAGDEPIIEGSESTIASRALDESSTAADSVTMVVTGIDVADPEVQAAVVETLGPLTSELGEIDGVAQAVSPAAFPGGVTDEQAAPFVSAAGDGVAVSATIDAAADLEATHSEVVEAMEATDLAPLGDDAEAHLTSGELVVDAINAQIQTDLVKGEAIGLPIALLIMVLVFGGFLAAALPVIGALASIVTGMGVLLALTWTMDIQSFVLNVVTVLGLGLSIDYGLLVVSRFREEVARITHDDEQPGAAHVETPDTRGTHDDDTRPGSPLVRRDPRLLAAVRTTVETAGRTVFFSAVTVAISVAGLLLMRPDILTTISAGAVAVVLLAVVAAVTLVPAILVLVGHVLARGSALARVPGLRVLVRAFGDTGSDDGAFARLARFVHRHPWAILVGVVALLAAAVVPLGSMTLRASTIEMVPADTSTGQAVRTVAEDYPALGFADVYTIADASPEELGDWSDQVGAIDGVEAVGTPSPLEDGRSLVTTQLTTDDPGDATGVAVTEEIRALDPGFETFTGGTAGAQIDFTDALIDGLPLTAGVVVVAVFVLLFLMTGSLLIPLKALLINLLSIAASLGLTSWLFTSETGSSLIGLGEPHAGLETYVVAIIVAFGFGLAMDYEVFLLARIKEYWDSTGDNDLAVERGLQRSGRIITSAAAIIIAVFLGFALGEIDAIQQVGLGLALTVLIDATLVRMLLVPATMTLLGRWNWWAPAPLRRLYSRFSIEH
ncbi:MMPL family transporter [Georgenia sp. Z1344]|uniref:MMPL family transporter n=1 Tax=Georgenia sp. Z1344 TaxID=3416706 RepID=UPI003CE7E701